MNSSSKKTLLVLAASHYQCEAIRTAQRLGYRVVTTDNRPDNPGHRLADRAYSADTTDRAAVLAVARAEKIAGVLAPCTDVAMPAAACVAGELGLRGPSFASTVIACDKVRFREFLAAHGFALPQFHALRDSSQWPGTGRWIVKPTQSSGSKGVRVVATEREFLHALPDALAHSKSREGVIEEYIDGHQGTLEGWLRAGAIEWHCMLDRETAPLPHAATHGHATPSRLSREESDAVLEVVARLWRELGVSDGPFDCDFIVRDGTVFILEVSPRLGGNAIAELVRSACGFDLVEHTVRWACGEILRPLKMRAPSPRAIVLLGAATAGALDYDRAEAAQLAREPWVESLAWDLPPGAPVQPFIDGRHRVGQALVAATTRDELEERVQELRRRLNVTAP